MESDDPEMDEPEVICVNLIQSEAGKDFIITENNIAKIMNKFYTDTFLYLDKNYSTCLIYTGVKTIPQVTKCMSLTKVRNDTLYYRRGSEEFSFVHACDPNILKHLNARKLRRPAMGLTYDLSKDTFVSKQSDLPVRLSKWITPHHQTKSLRSCLKARREERIELSTLPFGQEYCHETLHMSVQATDGPHENVEYDSPLTNTHRIYFTDVAPPTPLVPSTCYRPHYRDERLRVATFSRGWPHPADVQNTRKLAEYGLYYTGPGDLVRCYKCGLGMKDWSPTDDPLFEHVKFSPECLHLQEVVEPSLLHSYKIRVSRRNTEGRYRHPEYATEPARRATFDKWPRDLTQTPDVLAKAGFFYTDVEDRVRCFCCDGGLQHWDSGDDPWVEHARWFPHCDHVKTVKGDNYIRMVQVALQYPDDDEEESGPTDVASDMSALTVNGAHGDTRASDDVIYSPAVQSVITTCGFSTAAVRMAVQECEVKGVRLNSEILANLLFEKQERGEELPTDPQRPPTPKQTPVDVSTAAGLQQERQRLLSRLKCLQCETDDANILFLPCAHRKMCLRCSRSVTMCPICGQTVKEKVHTYMA